MGVGTCSHNAFSNTMCVSYIDGLVQDCSISIANALEILQSCSVVHPVNCIQGSLFGWFGCGLIPNYLPTSSRVTSACYGDVIMGAMGRVTTVREKSGKFQSFSESGKSQGILLQVRELCNLLSKSGKSQGISSVVPTDAYFSLFAEWYLNQDKILN